MCVWERLPLNGWPRANWGGVFRCGNETKAEQAAWDRYCASPVRGPRIGTRVLLGGRRSSDSLWVAAADVRVVYSEHLRQRVMWGMTLADRRREDEKSRSRRAL